MNNSAYQAGKNIRKVFEKKSEKLKNICEIIRVSASDKYELCYQYLRICADNDICQDSKFMLDMLSNENNTEIAEALILGLGGGPNKG